MTSSHPILYSFRRCPYAMRARMALAYTQTQVELREIVLKHKPQSLLDYSAKGTVPVLILANNVVIDESIDIMLWALAQHDPDNWLAGIDAQHDLIQHNDGIFKARLDKYKYADRYPEHSEQVYREACYDFLNNLDARLQHIQYLCSDTLGLADVAIFPFIRQFAHVDLAWFNASQWHHLKRWLAHLKSSELFTRVMTKYTAWQADDPVTYFP